MYKSPYYQYHNDWMEKHGHLFKDADKKTIKELKDQRMKYILGESSKFLNFTIDEDN